MQSHSASYPISARSPSTRPNPRARCPATFSRSAHRGRRTRMASDMKGQRCRGSRSPSRRPAWENGWQGYPPQMRSTRGTSAQSMVVTSPRLGTCGQCLARIRQQYGSSSDCHTTRIPARSSPMSRPPIPENMEPTVMITRAPPTLVGRPRGTCRPVRGQAGRCVRRCRCRWRRGPCRWRRRGWCRSRRRDLRLVLGGDRLHK